jgi:hypothetical protein
MEHSDHWIMTGWHGEQWDFQNNEKTMEHILITGSWLDGMENSGIFKTMKRQWNILITGSWLDGIYGEQWDFQNNEKTMEHSDHWMKQLLMKGSYHCTVITVIDVTLNSCVLFYLVKSSKNNQGLLRKSKVYLSKDM